MDRLTFGMRVLNITQSGTMLDGKPNLSHPNMALDLAGSNSGIDPYLNLEADTCFYCSGAFGTVSTGNTRFFVTCDEMGRQKKVLCADGVERVVTIALTHSWKSFALYHIYKPSEVMYQEGTAGYATGNHIHLEVASGAQKTKYKDTRLGVWRMPGEMDPRKAFFIDDSVTTVKSTHGLTFKHCNGSRVEENEMIYFRPVKDNVRLRSAPVNGTVLTYIWTGNRAQVLDFTGRIEADGYEWARVRYGKFTGYVQLDLKMYVLEK